MDQLELVLVQVETLEQELVLAQLV